MKRTISAFLKNEADAIRNPRGAALLAAAFLLSYVLQHYAAQVEARESINVKWLIINSLIFYLLSRIPGIAGHVARIYVSILVALNLTSIIYFGSRLTFGVIESGMETNIPELRGLLATVGITPVATFVGVLVFLTICTRKLAPTDGIGKLLLLASLLIIPMKLVVLTLTHSTNVRFVRWRRFPVAMSQFYVQDMVAFSDVASAVLIEIGRRNVLRESKRVRTLPSGVSLPPPAAIDARPRKIVLIVGESSAKSHHRLYGYPHGPEDFLQRLAKDSEHTLVLADAVSPAALTREALPRILSFASTRDDTAFTANLNLIELANRAGYSTAWLSNQQALSGSFDTSVTLISKPAAYVKYLKHDAWGENRGGHDVDLIAPFKEIYRHDDSMQFIVVHLIGSHESYVDRFEPEDYAAASGSPIEFRAYDASIHHSERVIQVVAQTISHDPRALMIYVPDHGEIVNVGHGLAEFVRVQYEIPLIANGNADLVASLRTEFAKYSVAGTSTFNTTNLIYVLAEEMGYSVDTDKTKEAIANAGYFFNADGNYYPLEKLH
jgi:glucan phosphoethanolaminetransferase (alkaline phosphatase superfamily)